MTLRPRSAVRWPATRVVLLLLCISLATLADSSIELFDGHTLTGWRSEGEASWQVQEGNIIGSGQGDGFLLHEGLYRDFRLEVEFLVDGDTNSGVFIRCSDPGNIHPDTCYELNIWDAHPRQEARTGAIVFRAMPPLAHVDTVGRWSTLAVTAQGGELLVKINGVTTATLSNADATAGFIALQRWGDGEVRFRRVVLEPL